MQTIIFTFGGRRQNLELQLPFIRRILARHPNVEYHLWDLARDEADHEWIQTVRGDRIFVMSDFYGAGPWWQQFDSVYRHYAHRRFVSAVFLKLDEDIVFLEDARFAEFMDIVCRNRKHYISANVVNNGACTRLEPGLWKQFELLRPSVPVTYTGVEQPSIELNQVHRHREFAAMAHKYFFAHWREMTNQPIELIPATDWLSINCIGYDYRNACRFHALLGDRTPRGAYADVNNLPAAIKLDGNLGDEGIVNLFPRLIMKGFTAAHLYFGPQRDKMNDAQISDLRNHYADIGQKYRASTDVEATA